MSGKIVNTDFEKWKCVLSEYNARKDNLMIKSGEIARIEELYALYGFTKMESGNQFLIFTYSNGYFYNAEIVVFNKGIAEIEIKKSEYEAIGYSVREIEYKSIEAMHELLFKGFFAIEKVNQRLLREYTEFYELQKKKLLDVEYEYVEPSYFWNNEFRKEMLISSIRNQMGEEGAQLIILEAAAGYGKTCTSYELIKEIAKGNDMKCAPIFTELSKNRKAALFRYVLLDEIDKKFTALSSQLVISEIQNGKVPLIIDGFDELLSRSNKSISGNIAMQDEDSQTMLDTIADLFKPSSKTKVVLTSRKSSIFTGDIFEKWVEKRLPKCTVTRVSIEEPTVQEWLGYEKTDFLKNKKIPFASIINPILLAFMRSMDWERFEKTCSDVENVIKYYFESLLEREKERQALQMTVPEQYDVMKLFAESLMEFEIVAEEHSFVRDLFMEIIHEKFPEYKERYVISEEKPTEEEFASKLAGHALLNRISPVKNYIGFINDFIFGIFVGEVMIDNPKVVIGIDAKYIDIACTAFASRSEDKKEELLKVVLPYIRGLNYEQQLDVELKLASTIKRDYIEHYFSNRSFNTDIYLDGKEASFQKCTFRNCTFNECVITTSAFSETAFYDCRFYNVAVIRDTNHNCGLIFSDNCVGHEEFVREASYEEEIPREDDYQKFVLKKYWAEGERFSKGRLPEMLLLRTDSQEERDGIELALESLKKAGLMFKDGHYWYINKERYKEIKEILEK